MKTTYTANVDLFLVDGEIIILSNDVYLQEGNPVYNWNYQQIRECDVLAEYHGIKQTNIIFSTKSLEGVKPLDRSKFAKPFDYHNEFKEYLKDNYNMVVCPDDLKKLPEYLFSQIAPFSAGHNANKAEFVKSDMFNLVVAVQNKEVVSYDDFEHYMNKLRPLSLPKSVTIENDIIVDVVW